MKALLILVITAACSPQTTRFVGRTALVASYAAMACDWGQTRGQASRGWENHYEKNVILGPTPSPGEVDVYFASMAVVHGMIWYLMPDSVRPYYAGGLAAIQTRSVIRNVESTGTVCGF